MGQDIGIEIDGERRVGLKFDEFPRQAHDGLLKRITKLTDRLESLILGRIPRRSGKLRSEVRKKVYDDKNRISGRVDIRAEFAKAAALEYGARRSTKVREHPQKLDHFWAKKLERPTDVIVSAYSRTPNIKESRFLRGPLAQLQPEVVEDLREEIETLQGGD